MLHAKDFNRYLIYRRWIKSKPSQRRDQVLSKFARSMFDELISSWAQERSIELERHTKKAYAVATKEKYRERNRISQRKRMAEYRSNPFHSDLEAILAHFDPDINIGKIVQNTHQTQHGYHFSPHLGVSYYVHRLVWMTANHRFIPSSKEINHKDGNKSNNNISNLEIVTHKKNMHHAQKLGLWSGRHRLYTKEEAKKRAIEITKKWLASRSPKQLKEIREKGRLASLIFYRKNKERINAGRKSEYNKAKRREKYLRSK